LLIEWCTCAADRLITTLQRHAHWRTTTLQRHAHWRTTTLQRHAHWRTTIWISVSSGSTGSTGSTGWLPLPTMVVTLYLTTIATRYNAHCKALTGRLAAGITLHTPIRHDDTPNTGVITIANTRALPVPHTFTSTDAVTIPNTKPAWCLPCPPDLAPGSRQCKPHTCGWRTTWGAQTN
jgi:hypothetical protein